MITNDGRDAIGRALASSLHSYIAVGIGSSNPTVNDKRLDFEINRAEVTNASYDAATRTIVFKAVLPAEIELNIAELGLVSSNESTPHGGILSTFDESLEEWTGGTWVTTNVRVGDNALRVSAGTASTNNMRTYTSEVSNTDNVQVAYHGAGGTVEVRLNNTATDYLSFNFAAATGPNVATVPVSSMTRTGDVSLSSINGITVIHTGAGSVMMDAIKFTRNDDEEIMIARQKLPAVERKVAGMPIDIEIPVTI